MLDTVQLVVTVGVIRNCEGTEPTDDQVMKGIEESVRASLAGHGSLSDMIHRYLPHDATLNYGKTKVALAPVPVPYEPGLAERLEHDRKEAADRFYEQFDFGDNIVADANGWDRILGQNGWKRVVFFENPNGGDSIRGEFYITFKDKSVEIEDGDYSLDG